MGINDILAAIDNMKRVGGRNIADLGRDPIGALSKIASNVKEQLGTEEGAKEFLYNSMTPGVGGIIKSKGGNWLTGSVENALQPLKKLHARFGNPYSQDQINFLKVNPQAAALNNWIEGPLTKYVKRDMATEGDPVRKLAEQGVLHTPMEYGGVSSNVYGPRLEFNKQPYGVANSDLAKAWENASDALVMTGKPRTMSNAAFTDNPWLRNLEPETPVHQISRRGVGELQFDHLTDELSNALNPESGLPRHLQLTPEQMQQLGMEKAVRHVADINAFRKAAMEQSKLKELETSGMLGKTVREYPEGLSWKEISKVDTVSDPAHIREVSPGQWLAIGADGQPIAQRLPDGTVKSPVPQDSAEMAYLQGQLITEGNLMGHCVGGYCDKVASGDTRIFSLRDAKGEPHVTVEVDPGARRLNDGYGGQIEVPEGDPRSLPHILQIKGKQNRKPNDEYLPFVQDFVRNHPEGGKWGDIGDLQNTGLRQLGNAFNEMERAKLKTLGHDIQPTGYTTEDEIKALHDAFNSASGEEIPPYMRGYANGGLVSNHQPEPTWQPYAGGYILR